MLLQGSPMSKECVPGEWCISRVVNSRFGACLWSSLFIDYLQYWENSEVIELWLFTLDWDYWWKGFVEVRSLCCEVGFFPNETYFDTYSIILALILSNYSLWKWHYHTVHQSFLRKINIQQQTRKFQYYHNFTLLHHPQSNSSQAQPIL